MLSFNGTPKIIRVTLLILVVALSVTTVDRLVNKAALNLANGILNKTIWQSGQTATQRQRMLSWAAMLLETGYGEGSLSDDGSRGQRSMIPAIAIADYHRKQRDFDEALFWLHRAIEADPAPVVQDALILPRWASIDQKGNIVLDWASNWRFRSDSQTADLTMHEEQDWLTISYENTLGRRDKVIYQWAGPLDIPYWHKLRVKARIYRGTFLTVETHSAAGVERYVNYFKGSSEWEEFIIPLNVDEIKWIYISVSEPSADSSTPDYVVDIEPLMFLLDEADGGCE